MIFKDKTKGINDMAPYLQAGGRRFESGYLHKRKAARRKSGAFFCIGVPSSSLERVCFIICRKACEASCRLSFAALATTDNEKREAF